MRACLDEDLRDLGPGELRRRDLPLRQHIADLRPLSVTRLDPSMRAGLGRTPCRRSCGRKRVLEEERRDAEIPGRELVENLLASS